MSVDTPHTTLVRYGSHSDQVAELTLPAGEGPHRIAVLIHGGFWRSRYDRGLMRPMAADLVERGWGAWNIEYRRGPESGAGQDTVADVRTALAALDQLDLPIDPEQRVVIGHSAGGHLALLTAAESRASLVISLAGVADLLTAAAERIGREAVQEFLGDSTDSTPEQVEALDPMAILPTGAVTWLIHGDADEAVPLAQSEAYLAAAQEVGDDCSLLLLPGVDHMAIIDPSTEAYRAWAVRLGR